MKENLESALKILHLHSADTWAAGSTYTSKVINARDFDELLIALVGGAFVSTAEVDVQVKGAATAGGSFANISGALMELTEAGGDGGKTHYGRINLREIDYPFLTVDITVTTANAEFACLGLLSGGEKRPVVQEDGTSASPSDFAATVEQFTIDLAS